MTVSKQWAMIRSWLRKTHNQDVIEFFKDLPPEQDPDNSSGRSTSKAVCLIGAQDSQNIALIKIKNFEYLKSKSGMLPQQSYPYASLPDPAVQGKPQIQLWFYEKYSSAKSHNRQQVRTFLSFRANENLSLAEARGYALRIKQEFATPIYHYDKGRLIFTYFDKKKQYLFNILAPVKSEAKDLLSRLFNVMQDAPDWSKLRTNSSDEDFDKTEIITLLGEQVRIGPHRPEAHVYFRHAIAKIPPLTTDFPLVDTTGDYWNAMYHEPNPYLAKTARPSYNKSPNLRLI